MASAAPAKRRWRAWAIFGGVALLAVIGLGVAAFQPWTANHFGYALPGRDGLPYRIMHAGRHYARMQVCAGASWCHTEQGVAASPRCVTAAQLAAWGDMPLTTVGSLPTLLEPAHPILTPANGTHSLTAPLVIADGPDCYVLYGLEGGP